MEPFEGLHPSHLVTTHHMRSLLMKHGSGLVDLTHRADRLEPMRRDHRLVGSASSACDGVAKRSPFKKRSTVRGEMVVTMPRFMASSASSRGVQALTGRSTVIGCSQASAMICMYCSKVKVPGAPERRSSVKRTSMA